MSNSSWSELMKTILDNGTFTLFVAATGRSPTVLIEGKRGSRKGHVILLDKPSKIIQAVNGTILLELKKGTIRINAKKRTMRNHLYNDSLNIIEANNDYGLTILRSAPDIEQRNQLYHEIDVQIIEKS